MVVKGRETWKPELLLRLLSDELNIRIISILWGNPSNPRRISRVLGVDESVVSRRLKSLERAGIVRSKWSRQGGKNVKLHMLITKELTLRFSDEGIRVEVRGVRPAEEPVLYDYSVPTYRVFVGREEELERLKGIEGGVVFVTGIAGIGKTALVAKYARESGLPVLWTIITPATTFFHVVRRAAVFFKSMGYDPLLRALEAGVMDPQSISRLFAEALKQMEVLVVFDDYHRCMDESLKTLIQRLAEEETASKVIVTSRVRPDFYLPKSRVIELSELPLRDVEKMFSLLGVDRQTARLAYKLLGGHAYMLNSFITSYKAGSVKLPGNMSVFKYYLLNEVIRKLPEDERRAIEVISAFREPAPFRALLYCGFSRRDARRALKSLEDKMLVNRIGRSYIVHKLLRDVSYQNIRDPEYIHKSIARYYLSLRSELAYIEAIYHYVMAEEYEAAAELLPKCIRKTVQAKVLSLESYINLLKTLRARVKGVHYGYATLALATAYIVKGEVGEAARLLGELAEKRALMEAPYMELMVRINQSVIHRYGGRYGEAIRHVEAAEKIARRYRKFRWALPNIYLHLTALRYFLGEIEEAEKSVSRLRRMGIDEFKEALALGWTALIERVRGRLESSERHLKKALELFASLGAVHGTAVAYRELGNTYMMWLRMGDALDALARALSIAEQNSYGLLRIGALIDMAIVNLLIGNVEEGERLSRDAEKLVGAASHIAELEVLINLPKILLAYRRGLDPLPLIRSSVEGVERCSFYRRFQFLSVAGAVALNLDPPFGERLLGMAREMLSGIASKEFLDALHRGLAGLLHQRISAGGG